MRTPSVSYVEPSESATGIAPSSNVGVAVCTCTLVEVSLFTLVPLTLVTSNLRVSTAL